MSESYGDGDIRLDRTLEACRAGTQKSRSEGMRDLKAFFDRRHKANIDVLTDQSFHKICEDTFYMAVAEIQVFLAVKKNTRGTAEFRLETCGDVVRTVIVAGGPKLKPATVAAILEHITQTLPRPSGGYYEPLAQHYLKALTALFDHQANVEHLTSEAWTQAVDFCLLGITSYLEDHDRRPVPSSSRTNSGIGASHPSSSATRSGHSQEGSLSRQNAEDLFQTLHLLVSAPNVPLPSRYSAVGDSTIRFLLTSGSSASQLHQIAFSTLNTVLRFTRTDRTNFCQSAAQEVLPVICRFWQGKALAKDEMLNSVRDEMLIFIFYVHLHLERVIKEGDASELLSRLEELSEAIRADYARRSGRDQLQLGDLDMADFGQKHPGAMPLSLYAFRLRPHNVKAERNWAILRSVGIIERLLSLGQQQVSSDDNEGEKVEKRPSKRQRLVRATDRILDLVADKDENIRLAGLQILPFVLQDSEVSSSVLSELLTQLHACAGDKRGNITSWALLAVASCTAQTSAAKINRSEWTQLWQFGTRSLTFSATCRAAALELHSIIARGLVRYHEIGEDVGAIVTSADISGPIILCDSSMFLMIDILHARITEVPAASLTTAQHVIRWLFARWNPDDGNFATRYSIHVQPQHLMSLVRACLGLPRVNMFAITTMPCGPLGQAWHYHLTTQKMVRYLLLLADEVNDTTTLLCPSCPKYSDSRTIVYVLSTTHFQTARKLVLELLQPKSRDVLQIWKSYIADRVALISTDMFRSVLYSCITVLLLMANFTGMTLPQLQELDTDLEGLIAEIMSFLAEIDGKASKGSQPHTETMLQSIQPYLPPCGSSEFSDFAEKAPHLLKFSSLLAESMSRRCHTATGDSSLQQDVDMMDIDDDDDDNFAIREPHAKAGTHRETLPRQDLALEMWTGSYHLTVTGYLMLIAAMSTTPDLVGFVPTSFIDYLVLLNDQQFLSSRWLLQKVLASDLVLEEADAYRILERVGEILQSDDYDRCEVALGACLDALVGLGPRWSMGGDSSVADAAPQLYRWFLKALQKHVVSPEVEQGIARVLLFLMRANPEYGISWKKLTASPRSSLFSILERGNIPVKFYIGNQVSQIFDLFILKDHDNVFEDIFTKLPMDPDWLEGISFRLFVLAKLASQWSTLLRRCIYYIFEAPGKMPNCIAHATTCLKEVASSLNVDGPRDIFALFAPQLLYTWLGTQKIEDIPFAIFGFSSLQDLVKDAQEEATALMIMRGQDKSAQELAVILGIKYGELIQKCFTKIVAYSVPYDMATPQVEGQVSGEKRVKGHIGDKAFKEYLHLHFADIIAVMFNIINSEQSVDKYFMKDEALTYAGNIMHQIKKFGMSSAELPAPQQPHFKARYLHAELVHVCRRTGHDCKNLFTPALFVSIARKLFNGMHSAFGSLYACSVLRKIRVLVALAGNTSIQGYPLEMLLQSIRPFVTDPECADDAIGIIKYLMSAGAVDLLQKPTFVAGLALSLSGSLRSTFDSQKASTTQESQHQSTMSKAQDFYRWVDQYLKDYESPVLKSQLRTSFQNLVQSAFLSQEIGNADKNSAESNFLIHLLKDEQRGGLLLERPSRELALSLLSSDFRSPLSYRTDVFGDDASSMQHAAVVWKSCRGSANQAYLSWAARVMGRAFAASGHIHEELLQESTLSQIKELSITADEDGESRSCILSLLRELTLAKSPQNAGLAETALRVIMSTSDGATYQHHLPESLLAASSWAPYEIPPSDIAQENISKTALAQVLLGEAILEENWLQDLSIAVAQSVPNEPLLHALVPILQKVPGFADRAFPFIVHLAISTPQDQLARKEDLSLAFFHWFDGADGIKKASLKMLLNTILYLRTQPLPQEKSIADRSYWLSIDFLKAATAATQCGMFKTAILFAEEHWSLPVKASRRSSAVRDHELGNIPPEVLLGIFENIDDPDMYYGVQQNASLNAILARFDYEKDGSKSLAFRGAQYDSHIRRHNPDSTQDVQSLVKALDVLNLSGLSSSLLQAQQSVGMSPLALESMFRTARKLEQWDIPVPSTGANDSVTIYKAFQAVNLAVSESTVLNAVNEGLERTMKTLVQGELSASDLHSSLQTLASLVELDEVLSSRGSPQFEEILSRFKDRSNWMKTGSFDDISQILSCRGTTLSMLNQEPRLQRIMHVQPIDTRIVEVETALLASTINRAHGALQDSLSLATSMMDLIKPCHDVGVNPEVSIQLEAANALWDQGEMASSIRMLQALDDEQLLKKQTIIVPRSDLLTKTGYRVSVARLQGADQVISEYLRPALGELKGRTDGFVAGQVFHQFATFCDQQLQDPDSIEDLARLEQLTKNKANDVEEFHKLYKRATGDKTNLRRNLKRNETWLKLDREELTRHQSTRDEFVRQCLENYLLALAAFDEHDSNALRFSALWMEHSEKQLANEAVSKHLSQVPSRKFAPLMNQLTSRLQDTKEQFQTLLIGLVYRICTDHPFHGMYQVYTGAVSEINHKDESSVSRRAAASKVSKQLDKSKSVGVIWASMQTCNRLYSALARETNEQKYRSGKRISVKDSVAATNLNNKLAKLALPPSTMQIPLSPTSDYTELPTVLRLDPVIRIASGVSAPKIIVAIASNGVKFTQLVKGGNDDLRQDSIMEQVFEQVSELLQKNKSTRQRNLSIKTYRVLPLTNETGVLEFVANTIPLHEFLIPAHEKYHPKDLKANACRKAISDVQTQSHDTRLKIYRQVAERFHPAMRYFFTERFPNPDKWFLSRLAYTRSTAAISMLGHVLGLGDRHGHNILLDQRTGEVVHIDLGVAFEMGRVLAVPEIIPFRCTRDIVDGMGITKTEGVFRRCCEFTLETLRKESSTIMAILEVLRYDPLYSWSINPIRMAKIQEGQSAALAADVGNVNEKRSVNEPGEADRALTVVNKKLSKTLSVTATVNDLINQATDEKNLAMLFSGWAAYA